MQRAATILFFEMTIENPEVQQAAVATLVYHCGVSVDMNYGSSGSGAQTSKVKMSLASGAAMPAKPPC